MYNTFVFFVLILDEEKHFLLAPIILWKHNE